jgi:CheY-like chemotaxis protein
MASRFDLATTAGTAAAAHRAHLDLSGPLWAEGDVTRIAHALGNLLHIAAGFTDRDGLSVRVRSDGDRAAVTVTGTGPGLGAEFTFWLPQASSAPPAPGEAEPRPSARPLRVLMIEDNRDAARSLQLVLELFGHDVLLAHDGPAGMTAARAFRPDVVLCDLNLPGMDGYAVAEALRQDPDGPAHLVAVSGYGSDNDEGRCREAGFERLLVKPVDPEDLRVLLAALVPVNHSTL